jgi:hypothetical protein
MLIEEAEFMLLPETNNNSSSGGAPSSFSSSSSTPSLLSSSSSNDESNSSSRFPVLTNLFSVGGGATSSQPIHLALFNDALLIAVPLRRNKLLLERFVPLERVRVLERPPGDPILYLDAFGYVYKYVVLASHA